MTTAVSLHDRSSLDCSSLAAIDWPRESIQFRDWLSCLTNGPANEYVSNCNTDILVCQLGRHVMPVTVNDDICGNSYVCSPYAGMIEYPLFELRELQSRLLRISLAALMHSLAPVLRIARIDRCVIVNNWLLSTNLFPAWDGEHLDALLRCLTDRFPSHAILFRSLNPVTNATLIEALQAAELILAPSRQVYIFDPANNPYINRPNTRWDLRLLEDSSAYEIVPHECLTDDDDERIRQLYDCLYLKKYTPLNPQFTVPLIRCLRRSGGMRFQGLRGTDGSLDGIIGFFQRNGVLTAPIVGYDTSQPRQFGLYRMLMAIALREAANANLLLNLSSGAAQFKRLRGGRPCIEYTAIHCRHLSRRQQYVWRGLAGLLTHVGARLLRRYEL